MSCRYRQSTGRSNFCATSYDKVPRQDSGLSAGDHDRRRLVAFFHPKICTSPRALAGTLVILSRHSGVRWRRSWGCHGGLGSFLAALIGSIAGERIGISRIYRGRSAKRQTLFGRTKRKFIPAYEFQKTAPDHRLRGLGELGQRRGQ